MTLAVAKTSTTAMDLSQTQREDRPSKVEPLIKYGAHASLRTGSTSSPVSSNEGHRLHHMVHVGTPSTIGVGEADHPGPWKLSGGTLSVSLELDLTRANSEVDVANAPNPVVEVWCSFFSEHACHQSSRQVARINLRKERRKMPCQWSRGPSQRLWQMEVREPKTQTQIEVELGASGS